MWLSFILCTLFICGGFYSLKSQTRAAATMSVTAAASGLVVLLLTVTGTGRLHSTWPGSFRIASKLCSCTDSVLQFHPVTVISNVLSAVVALQWKMEWEQILSLKPERDFQDAAARVQCNRIHKQLWSVALNKLQRWSKSKDDFDENRLFSCFIRQYLFQCYMQLNAHYVIFCRGGSLNANNDWSSYLEQSLFKHVELLNNISCKYTA